MISWLRRSILSWLHPRPRVDGATAVAWETGYYTKDRKDLPYPVPPKDIVP